MEPRRRASVLWGLVGGLAFLVLIQGYELWAARGVDATVKAVVALCVAVLSAVLVFWARGRVRRNESP